MYHGKVTGDKQVQSALRSNELTLLTQEQLLMKLQMK